MTRVFHTFAPVADENSRVLILGSFPSVKSREQGFYYGHPQNRFWKVMAALFEEALPLTIEEKQGLLLRHGVAIWDVIESCKLVGSSDSSIRNVQVNDIAGLIKGSQIQHVFANGGKAFELYERFGKPQTGLSAEKLPSTSPANAAWSLERLVEAWHAVKEWRFA